VYCNYQNVFNCLQYGLFKHFKENYSLTFMDNKTAYHNNIKESIQYLIKSKMLAKTLTITCGLSVESPSTFTSCYVDTVIFINSFAWFYFHNLTGGFNFIIGS
jgi:hypothetical protein